MRLIAPSRAVVVGMEPAAANMNLGSYLHSTPKGAYESESTATAVNTIKLPGVLDILYTVE